MAREEASCRGLANVSFVNPGLDDRGMPDKAFQVWAGGAHCIGVWVEGTGWAHEHSPLPCPKDGGNPKSRALMPATQMRPVAAPLIPSQHMSASATAHLQLVMTHDAIHDMAHPQQVDGCNLLWAALLVVLSQLAHAVPLYPAQGTVLVTTCSCITANCWWPVVRRCWSRSARRWRPAARTSSAT